MASAAPLSPLVEADTIASLAMFFEAALDKELYKLDVSNERIKKKDPERYGHMKEKIKETTINSFMMCNDFTDAYRAFFARQVNVVIPFDKAYTGTDLGIPLFHTWHLDYYFARHPFNVHYIVMVLYVVLYAVVQCIRVMQYIPSAYTPFVANALDHLTKYFIDKHLYKILRLGGWTYIWTAFMASKVEIIDITTGFNDVCAEFTKIIFG